MSNNGKKLAGKVAVVTGASKGIGASIAKHLGAEGASVVVNYSSSKTGADKVEALNVTCPHAGCPVEFKAGPRNFLCPCHDSRFNLDGSLVAGARSPSPRAMDALEVEIREGSEVWVRFQNFEAGKASKVPVA